MSNESKILVVDDEPFNIEIMEELLLGHYSNVKYVNSGAACLETIAHGFIPELILLDVSMPNMSGYEVCEKVKDIYASENISVIFVSARGTIEEKMEGYNCGGDEYIVKPFEEPELLEKIRSTLAFRNELTNTKDSLSSAENAVFDALQGQAELGYVLQGMEALSNVTTNEEIAQAVFSLMSSFGLSSCIRITKSEYGDQYFNEKGPATPLEVDLLKLLSEQGRLYSFKSRTQFNYKNISLLVKNMPLEDEAKYGRYKDVLPFALSVIDQTIERVKMLAYAQKNVQLTQIISTVEQLSSHTQMTLVDLEEEVNRALSQLQTTIEERIPTMGLNPDQEDLVIDVTDSTVESVKGALSQTEKIKTELETIIYTLKGKG